MCSSDYDRQLAKNFMDSSDAGNISVFMDGDTLVIPCGVDVIN